MINSKLLIQPRLCNWSRTKVGMKCRALPCATCHPLGLTEAWRLKLRHRFECVLISSERRTPEKENKWTELCTFYINTTALDASPAKKYRNMFTYLQKHSGALERCLASTHRQGLLQQQSWNPAARQWHAHSLLALQDDDGPLHTLMGALDSQETDQTLGHTHTP